MIKSSILEIFFIFIHKKSEHWAELNTFVDFNIRRNESWFYYLKIESELKKKSVELKLILIFYEKN